MMELNKLKTQPGAIPGFFLTKLETKALAYKIIDKEDVLKV
ncbi:MAG: hypothetical protein WBA39_01715 [Rivularia sp. (in: cyanobacteria)]